MVLRLPSILVTAIIAAAMLVPFTGTQKASAWSTDPEVNTPICTASGDQLYPAVTSDAFGGAIVAWWDARGVSGLDLYAQRVNPDGVPQWAVDGAAISTADGEQSHAVIMGDGVGGATITWMDYRSGNWDVYAQRVNAVGVPQWTTNGVALCTAPREQGRLGMTSDGIGGVIIAWHDFRNSTCDIYAQRVNAAGVPQWGTNGVAICTAGGDQESGSLTMDGSGGAIVVWQDGRTLAEWDLYAQRVNAAGAPQWTSDGVPVCTAGNSQINPGIMPDGTGGAILAWTDNRTGTCDVYAQRLNSSGAAQWSINGVGICTRAGQQLLTNATTDGLGGMILTWTDGRSGTDLDIYSQRVSPSGATLWTEGGVAVCKSSGLQMLACMVPDRAGGATIGWMDTRNGNWDVYAQRLSSAGAPLWAANGIAVCKAENEQSWNPMVPDDSGGAIIVWMDYRSGGNYDIYSQRVTGDGNLGAPPGRPANYAPANGATGVSLAPALQSSTFSDPDYGDGQSASQWRVSATAGDYSNAAFDSGADNVNLSEIIVPAGMLNSNTTYYWQVRHRDLQGGWSAWSTETSFTTRSRAPVKPTNIGCNDLGVTPTLISSAFNDPDTGDKHSASEWRVTVSGGDYSSPVFDSGTDNVNLMQITIPAGKLNGNTTYYWQVRHGDNHGEWSDWSAETSIVTQDRPPDKPAVAAPAAASAGASLTPVLQCLPFSDLDAGDTHAASQWRITAAAGDYSSPILDSGADATNLIELAVPSGALKSNSTYYWQVRHQDSHGEWSPWSEEASFTTVKESKAFIGIVVGAAAASLALVGAVVAGLVLRGRKGGGSQEASPPGAGA